jgi:hypothetical protein
MSDHYQKYKETIDRNTYKWREAHKEKWVDYTREYHKKNFPLYKDAKNKRRNAKYHFNKEWQSLLSILVNFHDS